MVNEGRHQGGRAPYGYVVVDGGPHPNPRKAVAGYRLRVLAVDEPAAAVVRRIFAEYLDGFGDRAIANGLNRGGTRVHRLVVPNRTRTGWPMGGRRARCGPSWRTRATPVMRCLVGGRSMGCCWTRMMWRLGMVVRFRRSTRDRIVRFRMPAHPAIVSGDVHGGSASAAGSCGMWVGEEREAGAWAEEGEAGLSVAWARAVRDL